MPESWSEKHAAKKAGRTAHCYKQEALWCVVWYNKFKNTMVQGERHAAQIVCVCVSLYWEHTAFRSLVTCLHLDMCTPDTTNCPFGQGPSRHLQQAA